MTATVFVFLLACLLMMRFFFTCTIVFLIAIFLLTGHQPARADEPTYTFGISGNNGGSWTWYSPNMTPQSDTVAANQSKEICNPAFVTMDAVIIHATVACNKNYMDTEVGLTIMDLSHMCYATLGPHKFKTISKTAMLDWEEIAKEKGKKEACAETDALINDIKAALQTKN